MLGALSAGSGFGKGLLQLGGQLFGGLLGSRSNKRARQMAQSQFDAQMDTTIQRRVADAKKAGIHPLAALGSGAGASPTLSAAPTGSAMGDSIKSLAEQLGVIETNKSQARLDESQAAYYDALAAKARSDLGSRGRDTVGANGEMQLDTPELPANRPGNDAPEVEVLPRQVTPSRAEDPGRIVGSVPTMDTIVMPDGRELQVPNREYFEELGEFEAARRIIALYGTDKIESIIDAIRNQRDVQLARIWERAYRRYMERSRYSRRLERDRNTNRRQAYDLWRNFGSRR